MHFSSAVMLPIRPVLASSTERLGNVWCGVQIMKFPLTQFSPASSYFPLYLSIYLSIYGSTALVDLGRFFSFVIHTQSVGLLGRWISPSQGRYLHREQHKHRINAHRHPCHPVGFELTIPAFERAKTFHASDRAAIVIGLSSHSDANILLDTLPSTSLICT
jgi:hypothetical protein